MCARYIVLKPGPEKRPVAERICDETAPHYAAQRGRVQKRLVLV